MPTGQVATIVGTAVTAISEGSNAGGSGCSGTIDVQVYQTPNVNYGMILLASDSTAKSIVDYVGKVAGITTGGNNVLYHMHPSVIPTGILLSGGGQAHGTECDATANTCFLIQNLLPVKAPQSPKPTAL